MKDAKNGITVTLRRRGLAERRPGADVRSRARVDRPQAELRDSRSRQDAREGRTSAASSRSTSARATAEPNIFAIGDVVGEPMLAHKASHEARVAVEAIAGHTVAFEPQAIPAVVFTDPEVAWCGLTETDAQKQGRKVESRASSRGRALGRAVAIDRPDGMTKLVIDPETERMLGVGIVGPGAGELIAEGVLAVEMGAPATDLEADHPSASDAVGDADGSRRGLLRPVDARLQAEAKIDTWWRSATHLSISVSA